MDYQKALERSIIYIENHLNEEIKVQAVASHAGYSYFHLNRQFKAILGESIGNYIRKRRLANAAYALLYTNNKIIDIAIENGFDSAEAFSRAFKLTYTYSPQDYRKKRLHTLSIKKEYMDKKRLDHLMNHLSVLPKIVELPEIKIVGLRCDTSIRESKLKDLWEEVYKKRHLIENRVAHARGFGVCEYCGDNFHYTISCDKVFSDVVGFEVSDFTTINDPFVSKVITGGRYAVFTHHGSLETFNTTFEYIWGTWLLTTHEKVDVRECFELYDERFLGYNHPDTEVDIYIAIK